MQAMKQMARESNSSVTEFILMGLTVQPELQLPLFALFLLNYTATVLGNLSLVNLICLNSHLHTPMYFFIFNLSCIDFCYSLVCTPKMLMSFVLEKNTISFTGCMTQLFFFCFFANSECYVLTAMAYDRYVAICQPLQYTTVMSPKICGLLMFGSYLMGFAGAMVHTGFMIRLSFCDSNIINHYMCDIFPLLQLSCSITYVNELVSSAVVGTIIILSSLIILVSYAMILFNIIHMSSGKGWSKALGTCGSHIVTVSLFYGSGLLAYVKPSSAETVGQGKFFSVFYTLVVPMLNPLIYSLWNKDIKLAVKKTMKRITLLESIGLPLPTNQKWVFSC
ncbi:olfactory receptor 143-like [Peromyscus leucopus]|uniref:olfactory receptor 143-like n=1 Tax=Peromyscus leucopus TaxID=10041 RepID=UPI0010A1DF87|nr:olfactory receptor 143-like [Peromyscus leucopus]